jgi:hypothetical protein
MTCASQSSKSSGGATAENTEMFEVILMLAGNGG